MGAQRPTDQRLGGDSYEAWLLKTKEEIAQAISEAENEGWHHVPEETVEGRSYRDLVKWYESIHKRLEAYGDARR